MNKQELIKNIRKLTVYGRDLIEIDEALNLVNKLDEPEKVTIPKFVAEHIEWTKKEDFYLLGAMSRESFDKTLEDWFYTDDNMEIFARAWLDGYEVAEKKRYIVSLKNGQPLVKSQSGSTLYFSQDITAGNYKATRKELEENGFGWGFDCEGIEIEEVTE